MTLDRIFRLRSNAIYYICFYLLIVNQVLAQSQFNEMHAGSFLLKLTRWSLLVIFACLIVYNKRYQKKGMFVWGLFVIFSVAGMVALDGGILLIILCSISIASYRININRLYRVHVAALITGLLLVIGSSLIGILDSLGVYKRFDNLTGFLFRSDNMRYAYGFINSNIIPITCLYLYLYICLIKRRHYKWWYDLAALILNYLAYLRCGSRVCILLLFAAVLLRWIIAISSKTFMKIFVPGSKVLLVASLAISLILPTTSLYHTSLVTLLDKFLTARISIARNVLSKYPVTILGWGPGIIEKDTSGEYLVMDNGYLSLFVTRGAIIGMILIVLLLSVIIYAQHTNDPYLLMFVMIMIVANLVDNSVLHYITFPIYVIAFDATMDEGRSQAILRTGNILRDTESARY